MQLKKGEVVGLKGPQLQVVVMHFDTKKEAKLILKLENLNKVTSDLLEEHELDALDKLQHAAIGKFHISKHFTFILDTLFNTGDINLATSVTTLKEYLHKINSRRKVAIAADIITPPASNKTYSRTTPGSSDVVRLYLCIVT